jgi:hypothetical protein
MLLHYEELHYEARFLFITIIHPTPFRLLLFCLNKNLQSQLSKTKEKQKKEILTNWQKI